MLRPAAVTCSKVPVIVTFGAGGPAGACAKTGGASIARMTKASTAVTTLLLITASSSGGEKHRIQRQHSTPTSPTTPERSRTAFWDTSSSVANAMTEAPPFGPAPYIVSHSGHNKRVAATLRGRCRRSAGKPGIIEWQTKTDDLKKS